MLVPVGSDQLAREVAALRCGLDTAAWETDGPESCKSLFGMTPAKSEPLPFDLARAHALYTTLFSHFKEHIDGKQLLFVAAGPLASLPLHVLVAEKPTQAIPRAGNGYVTAEWLAKRHAISVLPSVASLASLRAVVKTSLAAKPLIGFGNPLLTGRNGRDRSAWARTSCRGERSQQSSRVVRSGVAGNLAGSFHGGLANTDFLRRQMPLPETADELCAVARVLAADDGDVNLGARATETAVKALNSAGSLATYKFVHFATHGLLAGETESVGSAAEPSLMLTPPETATEADDGLLTASEVAQLKLDAEWVVLSACNTAGGETNGAEALSGLARAFIYAGARALLVSHWYVDSDAAVKLVTKALEEWKRDPKIGRAEATRRAMIAAMRDPALVANWAPAGHPSVWAPFVLVGEGR